MKKLLLLLSFFAFTYSFSQTYTPLLKDGNKWHVKYFEADGGSYNCLEYDGYYYAKEDTIINSIPYKKIFYLVKKYCNIVPQVGCTGCYDVNYEKEVAFLREDVSQKKVYQFFKATNQENLMYDFSANINDNRTLVSELFNLNLNENPNSFNFTVTNKGKGTIFDTSVNYISFNNLNIYEGIGSQGGLLFITNNICPQPFELSGSCFYAFENINGISYNNTLLGSSETKPQEKVALFYFKNTKDFKLLNPKNQEYKIKFYDFSGTFLEEITTNPNERFRLKSNINSKFLIYIISSKTGYWKGKIML